MDQAWLEDLAGGGAGRGVSRNSHHRTGSPASASNSHGERKERLPKIMRVLLIRLGDLAV